jgi:hypothetical protein
MKMHNTEISGWWSPAVLALCAFVPCVALAQVEGSPTRHSKAVVILEPLASPPAFSAKFAAGAKATYPVRLRSEWLRDLESGMDVLLQFSSTNYWEGKVQRVERRNPGSFSVFGQNAADDGWFIFTVDSGGVMASVNLPQKGLAGALRRIQEDAYWLNFYDAGRTHGFICGTPPPSPPASAPVQQGDAVASAPQFTREWAPGDPPPQHDIMVLYTKALTNDFPNHFPGTPLETAIQNFVDFANMAYANSGVNLRMRLVYRGLVDPTFSEAGRTREWLLDNLAGTSDIYLDQVHAWRAAYHADLVCLLYSLDTQNASGGGLAYRMGTNVFNSNDPTQWYRWGFSVVEALWEPSSVAPPVSGMVPNEFAHEIGHNQGLDHDCENASAVGDQATSAAFGYRYVGSSGSKHVTIMGLFNGAYDGVAPIPFFSNPSVYFDGQPTGSTSTPACPNTTGAKNAQALNATADFISRLFRRPFDPWVDYFYAGPDANGRFESPWKNLAAAMADIPNTAASSTPDAPTITIKGPYSTGTSTITIYKRLILKARGGPVIIGGTM